MGMENQNGEEQDAVMQVRPQKPPNTSCQSSESSIVLGGQPTSTSVPQVTVLPNSSEIESSLPGGNKARNWLDEINSTDRTCALSFVDEPFLAALLSFSSWSEGPSSSRGSTRKYCNVLSTIRLFVWRQSVSRSPLP